MTYPTFRVAGMKVLSYIKNNLIALDQQLNTLLGGYPDETLSSRSYRLDRKGKLLGRVFRPLIDIIFFWQDKHCYNSYLSELHRKQSFDPQYNLDRFQ